MDALNFLKFWRHVTVTNSTIPHVLEETDNESDNEDSFFDLELTVHDFNPEETNNSNNKNIGDPEDKTMRESQRPHVPKQEEGLVSNGEADVSKAALPASSSESISKRKIHPVEPTSKPQSPIALLKSAPSFRISMFMKPKEKESKFFQVKLNMEESQNDSPSLIRNNSSSSYGRKSKPERFSKDVFHKYINLIKPMYLKVSRKYSDKGKFSDEVSSASASASPMSSPSVSSVSFSSRKEKQGNIPAGIRVVRKHLGKSKSASAVTGVASPANRNDDSLLEQHDGIQSAILHCKRSFNARDSSFKEDDWSNM